MHDNKKGFKTQQHQVDQHFAEFDNGEDFYKKYPGGSELAFSLGILQFKVLYKFSSTHATKIPIMWGFLLRMGATFSQKMTF